MKVAIVQKPPALLDLTKTIAVAVETIEEAASAGANLIVFPEAFLPGYPTWIWRLRPGGDMALGNEIHARLRANSVNLREDGLADIRAAAMAHGVVVVMGFNEVDGSFSGTTLFNSVAIIGPDGRVLNNHRKLMPTNPERMVWGNGDARGLRVVQTPFGRIGTLICWENYMPLARYAIYSQNVEVYVAPTWDCGETWRASMNHIAREGGCWVLSCATALQGSDVPADFPGRDRLFDDAEWINDGDAIVAKPFGGIVAGPLHREKGILFHDIDLEQARAARKSLDVTGHYARPDIFRLEVDRRPLDPTVFEDGGEPETMQSPSVH